MFDKRGIGLSDPVPPENMPNLEERTDDVRAVLDAAGSERAALLGQGYGCPIALFFAASHPERVTHLVLYAPTVKAGLRTDDFPWGPTEEELRAWQQATAQWGTDEFAAAWVARLAPSTVGDAQFAEWAARMMRAAASPATNAAFGRMNSLMDAREVLPLIRVPTLVLDRADSHLPKGPVDMPPLEEAQLHRREDSRREARQRVPAATTCPGSATWTASSAKWASSSLAPRRSESRTACS